MFPAFRVKGLWPKPRGVSKSDGTHPLTGALLPKFENTETILQLPLNKYDELVADHPEYRLKYLDEDKDEITIGSEMELATKLEESTSHSRFVQRSEDPRFYTSIPECMHAFHINNDEETRKLWSFFESSTISRNRAAYKLWTSPQLDPWNKVQALLNEHAYEFMTGYNFEGFNSHYNYLSEAGQKIKALAAKRDPSTQESMSTTSSVAPKSIEIPPKQIEILPLKVTEPPQAAINTLAEPTQKAHRSHVSKEVDSVEPLTHAETPNITLSARLAEAADIVTDDVVKVTMKRHSVANGDKDAEKSRHAQENDTFRLTHAKISESMASLNDELDKHLETAQALTRMLDQTASPQVESAHQKSLQRQFDNQFEMARSATKMMNAVTKNRQSLPSTASPIPATKGEIQHKTETNIAPSASPSKLSLGFAKYALRSHGDCKSLDKTGPKELDTNPQGHPFSIPQPQTHLTDLGMKESREAGMKLRNQLYGSPKPYTGITEDNIRHWRFRSSDPPKLQEPKSSEKIAEPLSRQTSSDTITPLNKKKSVRFSFPTSARGEWHLDGSFSPGSRTIEPPIILEKATDSSRLEKSNMALANDQKSEPETYTPSPKDDSRSHMSTDLSEDEIIKIRELLKAFDEHDGISTFSIAQRYRNYVKAKNIAIEEMQPPQVVVTSLSDTTGQSFNDAKADSVETTVTKLWCQAYEGIMSNIDTFAEQLNTHVMSQISREQAAVNTMLAQNRPPCPIEDDQTFLDGCKQAVDLLVTQDTVQQMIDRLRTWNTTSKDKLAQPGLCSEYKVDVARVHSMIEELTVLGSVADISFQDLFGGSLAVSNRSAAEINEPHLQWIPRRYSSKIDPCDRKPEFDKTEKKQLFCSAKDPTDLDLRISKEQCRLYRQRIEVTGYSKNVAPDISAPAPEHAMNRSALPRVDSFSYKPTPPLFFHERVEHRLHPTEPSTANHNNNVNNDLHNQLTDHNLGQASISEPTESGNEPSDALLQNFPPLIPRREAQQDRHDLAKSTPFSSNSQNVSDPATANVSYPFLRRGHVYPSVKRYSAPPSCTNGSIPTQQLGNSPGWSWNPRHSQGESALTQQLNALPSITGQPKSTDSLSPFPNSPIVTIARSTASGLATVQYTENQRENTDDKVIQSYHSLESMNKIPRTPDRYETWNEDTLLPATEPGMTQDLRFRNSSASDQAKPASDTDLFQLYQDIPEHKDPKTAVKIINCVEKLKGMGCGNQVDGGDARLVVYAQAAGGNLGAALDIMEEERKAYAEQNDNMSSYYD